jgi:hypothetical protein
VKIVLRHAGHKVHGWRRKLGAGTHSVVWNVGLHAPKGTWTVVLSAHAGHRTMTDRAPIQLGHS